MGSCSGKKRFNKNQFPFCKWRIYSQHTTSGYNPYEPDMVSHCPLWWPHPSTATLHQRGWHEMDTQTRLHLSKWCGRFTCDVNRKCFICNKVVIVQFQGLSVTDSVSMQCLDYLLTFVTLPRSTLCIFNCLAHPYGCPQWSFPMLWDVKSLPVPSLLKKPPVPWKQSSKNQLIPVPSPVLRPHSFLLL